MIAWTVPLLENLDDEIACFVLVIFKPCQAVHIFVTVQLPQPGAGPPIFGSQRTISTQSDPPVHFFCVIARQRGGLHSEFSNSGSESTSTTRNRRPGSPTAQTTLPALGPRSRHDTPAPFPCCFDACAELTHGSGRVDRARCGRSEFRDAPPRARPRTGRSLSLRRQAPADRPPGVRGGCGGGTAVEEADAGPMTNDGPLRRSEPPSAASENQSGPPEGRWGSPVSDARGRHGA